MPSSISGLNFVDLCCLERVVMCFWRDYQKLLSSWFDLPIRVHYSFQTFENLGSCTFGAPAHVKIDRLSLKYKITWFLFVQQHLFAFLSLITFICFCVLEREVSFDGKIVSDSKVSKLYFSPPVCKESWQTRWSQTGVMEVLLFVDVYLYLWSFFCKMHIFLSFLSQICKFVMWASQWCICIYDLLQARAALMLALWTLWPQAGEIAADASQHQTRLVEIQIQIQTEIQMRLKYWILRETLLLITSFSIPWARCQNLLTKIQDPWCFLQKVQHFHWKGMIYP